MTHPADRAGDAVTGAFGRIRTLAARPVSGQSLAVFRIAFGLLMLNDVVHLLRHDWLTGFYIDRDHPVPLLRAGGAGAAGPLAAPAVGPLRALLRGWWRSAPSTGSRSGASTRIFIYVFLLDQLLYLNHFYMIALFGLLLGCTDAHRCWSLDRRLGRIGGTTKVPLWNLLILQFQVEVILIFAGLVKIEVDWLRGEPLRTWMLERPWSPLSSLFEVHWITLAAPVLIVLLHTVGAPLLLWSKTRLWVFLLYCAFHVTNAHLFNIGVFPWMTIAATTILFSPEWPSVLGQADRVQSWHGSGCRTAARAGVDRPHGTDRRRQAGGGRGRARRLPAPAPGGAGGARPLRPGSDLAAGPRHPLRGVRGMDRRGPKILVAHDALRPRRGRAPHRRHAGGRGLGHRHAGTPRPPCRPGWCSPSPRCCCTSLT